MIMNSDFEIVDIAGDYIAVPIGEESKTFNGVVALTEATAFLLNNMKDDTSKEELVRLLINEYGVERSQAIKDIDRIIPVLLEMGLIKE